MSPAEYYALYTRPTRSTVNAWSYLGNSAVSANSWAQWSYSCSTTSVTNPSASWQLYNNAWVANTWSSVIIKKPQAPAVLSQATHRRMQAEALAEQERTNLLRREERAKEEAARTRARALLMQSLTRDQQRSLEERSYFDLNVGGKHYRIRQGTHGNVRLVQGDRETVSYCAQPDNVPAEDAMLAQKLMLETDEPAFLRVANARQMHAGQ